MSKIKVTNNTNLPIHIAMTWAGIVQYYKNDLQPGASFDFSEFGTGWSDFTAVVGTPENEFSHKMDATKIMSFVTAGAGILTSIAGIALIPFSGGASAGLVFAGLTVTAASTTVAATNVAIRGVEGEMSPATIKGLFVSDHYTMSVQGGNIIGSLDEDGQTFHVQKFEPLYVEYKNETSRESHSTKDTTTA